MIRKAANVVMAMVPLVAACNLALGQATPSILEIDVANWSSTSRTFRMCRKWQPTPTLQPQP